MQHLCFILLIGWATFLTAQSIMKINFLAMFQKTAFSADEDSTIREVRIGTQVWMTRNLDVSSFRNGDLIPETKSMAEWKQASDSGQPAWCYYYNNPANGKNMANSTTGMR